MTPLTTPQLELMKKLLEGYHQTDLDATLYGDDEETKGMLLDEIKEELKKRQNAGYRVFIKNNYTVPCHIGMSCFGHPILKAGWHTKITD